ncbi:MAG: hypothetical protein CVV24_08875 [Ignavibacteriae bacterium HGW-Ignavibacteriae-3]|nr:MAG: hypothetical protein CVV24_08875 [Ignavibacteriae bacterium HGW-Ignavibacteriae-3]
MRILKYIFIPLLVVITAACSSLVLKPGDFSWPIESALKIDNKGFIEEQRYAFTIKVKPIFFEEFADSNNFAGKEIRIIRDRLGYVYITGKSFKNVYVFMSVEGGMKLEEKILVAEKGLASPAFNQKSPNIELLDTPNKYLLNHKGLVR